MSKLNAIKAVAFHNWTEQKMQLEGDLSELLQHEYDHLDGILAVSRAVDGCSFALRSQKKKFRY